MAAYFDNRDLSHFGDMGEHAPELWKKFMEYYTAAFQEGALSRRETASERTFTTPKSAPTPSAVDTTARPRGAAPAGATPPRRP